ncbi:CoA pyrophosphatase [Brevundimonas vesicularis]|uniref:CoA pyrophosphatase n=1 Tax=Brevundimonas vesicularis TaxID=41276 RepID=UPI0038D4F8C6
MNGDSLKLRLRSRLDPIDSWSPERMAVQSDFDLNPSLKPAARPLRPAAVLIPIIEHETGGPTVLMTRRSDKLASHTGQVAFPGGRLDPGEDAGEAALREALEEVALDPALVSLIGLGDSYETGTGFLVTPVVGWLKGRPHVVPSPDEVAEVFEVPWAFLMDPANHRQDHYDLDEGQRRWFWAMPYERHYIWGVTAGILKQMFHRLYGNEGRPMAAVSEDAV